MTAPEEEGATVALTYREIAEQLGLNLPAAKGRVRRRNWARIEPNKPRQPVRFQIPVAQLQAEQRGPEPEDAAEGGVDDDVVGVVGVLRDHLGRLEERLDRQAVEHAIEVARLRSEHAAASERERRDRVEEAARLREDRDREVMRLTALVERLATPQPGLIERVVNAIKGRK